STTASRSAATTTAAPTTPASTSDADPTVNGPSTGERDPCPHLLHPNGGQAALAWMRQDGAVATKKKQSKGSVEKELKAAVKKLRSQLAAAEKSAEKWK